MSHAIDQLAPDAPLQTVEHRFLRRNQFWHAAIMTTGIPVSGTVAAIWLACQWGIGRLEVTALVVMYVVTVVGLEVGFHRLLAHRSFRTSTRAQAVLAGMGAMCAQGPPIYWAATHRCHHQYSDHAGDPHSPNLHNAGFFQKLRGAWHAYMGWTFRHETPDTSHYARDLLKDPRLVWVNRHYYGLILLGMVLPALAGLLLVSWRGALLGLLWGGPLRIFLVTQAALSVTSLCHIVGSRPFHTGEQSRNTLLLVIPTFGQAWHNHHHAFPNSAIMALRWWQIDLGAVVIRSMEKLGLAWKINTPNPLDVGRLRRVPEISHPRTT